MEPATWYSLFAAQTALNASPFDEPARLALAAVTEATGDRAEPSQLLRESALERADDGRVRVAPSPRSRLARRLRARR
jgi:hypothetical protein